MVFQRPNPFPTMSIYDNVAAADHATNIAEDIIFWVQGNDVRHHKSVMLGNNDPHAMG